MIRRHALRRDGTVCDTVMYGMLAAERPEARQRLLEHLELGGTPRTGRV